MRAYLTAACCATLVLSGAAARGADEPVKKSKLSLAEATAEIELQEAQGYRPVKLDIPDKSKQEFDLEFKKNAFPARVLLACDHEMLKKEIDGARARKQGRFVNLKGYRDRDEVRFAVLVTVGPPGSAPGQRVEFDVPAPAFKELVEGEKAKGGKLVDKSTYKAGPDDLEYHTAIFEPK